MGRLLFVTGKLAHDALNRTLAEMAPPFAYDVAPLKITVAALMTTRWIASHLELPAGHDVERIIIPGLCEGDPAVIEQRWSVPTQKGPADLKDLPAFFDGPGQRTGYGAHSCASSPRSTMSPPSPPPRYWLPPTTTAAVGPM